MTTSIKIHPDDDLAVALNDLQAGEDVVLNGSVIKLCDPVPAKHKFTLKDIRSGDPVYMYGVIVGQAMQNIAKGGLVTTSNFKHSTEDVRSRQNTQDWHKPDVSALQSQTFLGYHRSNGTVGTANYWIVAPLVFCENRNMMTIKQAMLKELGYESTESLQQFTRKLIEQYRSGRSADELLNTPPEHFTDKQPDRLFKNVDGIKFLFHDGGCGGMRQDSDALCGLLAGYITHPNVAGATVLSLGCQHAQIDILEKEIHKRDPNFDKPVYYLEQQETRLESKLVQNAIRQTFVGLMQANEPVRQPAPLSKLTIGVECGGSDGFSGISSNPAIGYFSDLVVALGGSVILSEFPELSGVEQNIIDRCETEELANRFLKLFRAYEKRALASGEGFDSNPSPGNIRDGLISDAMKSAGAALKAGTSPIRDVLDYPEWVTRSGLSLLCTPGHDVESTTAMAGAGANLILFSTGLGTPTGNPVTPVIKISSNSKLFTEMPDIIDIDAGKIINGTETIPAVSRRIFDYCLQVASGERLTKAQMLNQDDFIPWKRGLDL
jgi:altronate hydrolase